MKEDGLASALPLAVEGHAPDEGTTHFLLRGAAGGGRFRSGGALLDEPGGAEVSAELAGRRT